MPVLLALAWGCAKQPDEAALEDRAAAHVIQQLRGFSSQGTERLTNMAQLYTYATNSLANYPYALEKEFSVRSGGADFTNSFYERYLVLPGGVTNEEIAAELVLVSAKPFEGREDTLWRVMISKNGETYAAQFVPESEAQSLFRVIGVPQASKLPRPPSVSHTDRRNDEGLMASSRRKLGHVAQDHLGGRGNWWLIPCGVATMLALVIAAIWLFLRGRSPVRK